MTTNEAVAEKNNPVPPSLMWRAIYVVIILVFPSISFLIVDREGISLTGDQLWQADRLDYYASILLGQQVNLVFAPFLLYAAASVMLLAYDAPRFQRYLAVRIGVYTGVILSLHYTILIILSAGIPAFPIIVVIAAVGGGLLYGIGRAFWWFAIQLSSGPDRQTIFVVTLGVVFIGVTVTLFLLDLSNNTGLGVLVIVPLAVLALGPVFCLIITVRMTNILLRHHESLLWQPLIALGAWLIAYGLAWQLAYTRMLTVYATLPEMNPNCYIATAAAQGHPRIVKSQPITRADGTTVYVNAQLQTLKAAELALLTTSPTLHRWLRRRYDWLGPRLAQRMTHPLIADAAYLALKPCEWLSGWLLGQLGVRGFVHKLYRSR